VWDYDPEPADELAERQPVLDDYIRRVVDWIDDHPGSRGLLLAWTLVIGTGMAGGGLLQVLGPPPERLAHATATQPAVDPVKPVAGAAQAANLRIFPHAEIATVKASLRANDSIPALLAKAQSLIADSPDALPPGEDTAKVLRRIAEALPQATPDDRARAQDLAADLFDKARTAMEAGKVSEEQHWLALGSILAPPPELGPAETTEAAPPNGASVARQDFNPNEAEVDQAVQDRHDRSPLLSNPSATKVAVPAATITVKPASSDADPSAATGGKPAAIQEARQPDQHPGALPSGNLPALRPPNARPPMLGDAGQAAPPSDAQPATQTAQDRSPARSRQAPTQSDFGQSVSPGADGALWRQRVVIHYPATPGSAAASEARHTWA
jgi:hypothetical protein